MRYLACALACALASQSMAAYIQADASVASANFAVNAAPAEQVSFTLPEIERGEHQFAQLPQMAELHRQNTLLQAEDELLGLPQIEVLPVEEGSILTTDQDELISMVSVVAN